MIEDFNDIHKNYDPSKNTTKNILSKYEKVKIIGLRAEQLQRGATPFVEVEKDMVSVVDIAKKELFERRLPFMLCRKLPNGKKEYWRLIDMVIL